MKRVAILGAGIVSACSFGAKAEKPECSGQQIQGLAECFTQLEVNAVSTDLCEITNSFFVAVNDCFLSADCVEGVPTQCKELNCEEVEFVLDNEEAEAIVADCERGLNKLLGLPEEDDNANDQGGEGEEEQDEEGQRNDGGDDNNANVAVNSLLLLTAGSALVVSFS